MKSLRSMLILLSASGLAVAAILAVVSWVGTLQADTAVQRAFVAKDVTADILPPPMYLIEMRLVLSQAVEGSMPLATAQSEFSRLEKEYGDRVTYWRANPPYGLEAKLLATQHDGAQKFIQAGAEVLKTLAGSNASGAAAALKTAHLSYLEHRAGVDVTVKAAGEFGTTVIAEYAQLRKNTSWVQSIVFAAAVGLVLALGWWVLRKVSLSMGGEPLQLAEIANAVARGDLSVPVHVAPGDTTSVMSAMGTMCSRLTQLVSDVRRSSDDIATGSSQIVTGSADLQSRTVSQAGELQKTASAMEQISSTVENNADTAGQATTLANSAREVATRGAEVMHRVVSTMSDITDSSKKIADITSVIDGIAFQTNILALNAAVEAARAGEQGRGFAVVASEVRSLAQRSAAAAKEISSLIGRSVEKVEAGSQLVGDAGTTMNDIVTQVKRVADLIGEISLATREQKVGISMISNAITELDAATQKNAALAQESAGAAQGLSVQADVLVRNVSDFQVG